MSKIITVFGATGNQGGSVIKHILDDSTLSREFKIRAITRDQTKPSAKALAEKGVELANADMDSKTSVGEAIKGSHTVFLVTNYWETADRNVEFNQGKNVADAAKEANVAHIIFSSLLNVTKATNGRLAHVPHFDGKADIEDYIRSTGVPCTFMLPGYFMSNLTQMIRKNEDGVYALAYPVSDKAPFPLFDAAEDTGKFVKAIINNADNLNGKRVLGATAYYTPKDILGELENTLGVKTQFAQISNEQYKSFLPETVAQEFLENHLFIEEPGYYNGESLDESLDLLDEKPTTWKEFIIKTNSFK